MAAGGGGNSAGKSSYRRGQDPIRPAALVAFLQLDGMDFRSETGAAAGRLPGHDRIAVAVLDGRLFGAGPSADGKGIACRRGPDLQKTLATLVLSEVPLNAEGATIFAGMREHGIIQNHCFPRNTKTSDRQNSGWNDTRISDGC